MHRLLSHRNAWEQILDQNIAGRLRRRRSQQDQSATHIEQERKTKPFSIDIEFVSGLVSLSRLPPHEADRFTSTSEAFALGVSFTGHQSAVIASSSQRPVTCSIPPNMVGLNGPSPVTWLRVAEPSENLEIHPTEQILAAVAETTGCNWMAHDGYRQIQTDPVIWGACARFRLAAIGSRPISPLEADARILEVTHHVAARYLGGRSAGAFKGRLDERRLHRVCDYLRENLDRRVSLLELSAVGAMSPYHFQRTFKLSTGLSPSDYVLALRAEQAHRQLASGATLTEACASIGIKDGSYLRRLLKRFCEMDGLQP